MISPRSLLILLITVFICHSKASALDAKQIFDLTAPSTVIVEDVDTHGTGIIVSEQGLILTTIDLALAAVDLKVKALIKAGSGYVFTEIKEVQVLKLHPAYGLALLQAKAPPNGSFLPANQLPAGAEIAAGSKCFAVGNSENSDSKKMQLVITSGLISSPSRRIDQLDYIQFSAAINSGNIGGPICDEEGHVVGVTRGKMDDREGISFGVSLRSVPLESFVDAKGRQPDKKLADAAILLATQTWLAAEDSPQGQEREAALRAYIRAARLLMLADANDVRPYNMISRAYKELNQNVIAQKYAEAAVKMAPNNSSACSKLGSLMYETGKNDPAVVQQCYEIWFRGLMGTKGSNHECAEAIATAMLGQEKWAGAAYMLQWAEALSAEGDSSDPKAHTEHWARIQSALPSRQFDAIRSKKTGFTKAEFDAFSAIKFATGNPAPAAPQSSAKPFGADQMEQVRKAAAAEFTSKLAPVAAEGLEIPLPGIAKRAILANSGWQIVLSLPNESKLQIVNLASGKLEGLIDCRDPDPLISSGGRILAVYAPSTDILEIYDLSNLQRLASRKINMPTKACYLGMGLLNPSRIFLLFPSISSGRMHPAPLIFAVPDLKPLAATGEVVNGVDSLLRMTTFEQNRLEGAMDESGAICALTRPTISPPGLGIYRLNDSGRVRLDFVNHGLVNHVDLSQKGAFVITNAGVFDPVTLQMPYQMEHNARAIAAIAGFPAFVEKNADGFRIHSLPSFAVLSEQTPPKAMMQKLQIDAGITAPILLASAGPDRIAYLVPNAKKMLLLPLNLKNSAGGMQSAEPGKHFTRKLNIAAGSAVVIQSGPPGLKYEPSTNSLMWEVPSDLKTGRLIQVILLVTPQDGRPGYVVEKITVQ